MMNTEKEILWLEEFVDILRQQRKELGLTQEILAEEAGVTRETVALWETGRYANLPISKLLKIMNILEVGIVLLEKERD